MASLPIFWVRQDNHGSVRAAYQAANGKRYYPKPAGAIWAGVSDLFRRNNPNSPFDISQEAAVYRIGGELYCVESVSSRAFWPTC